MKKQKLDRGVIINSVKYHDYCGMRLFGSSVSSLLNLLENRWGKQVEWVATVNPEFVMNTLKDRQFLNILQKKTTINVVDGIGLAWAIRVSDSNFQFKIFNFQLNTLTKLITGFAEGIKILRGQYKNKIITGVDLIDQLCKVAEEKGRSVFFYGGWDDRSQRTASYFVNKYPKLKVLGAQPEDYDFKTKVDYLFVCRAMKKQEEWINEHFDKLNVKLVIGLGRTFDYYSGDLPRAPRWMQSIGLEWLYSLFTDKGRRKRKLDLLKFIWMVIFS